MPQNGNPERGPRQPWSRFDRDARLGLTQRSLCSATLLSIEQGEVYHSRAARGFPVQVCARWWSHWRPQQKESCSVCVCVCVCVCVQSPLANCQLQQTHHAHIQPPNLMRPQPPPIPHLQPRTGTGGCSSLHHGAAGRSISRPLRSAPSIDPASLLDERRKAETSGPVNARFSSIYSTLAVYCSDAEAIRSLVACLLGCCHQCQCQCFLLCCCSFSLPARLHPPPVVPMNAAGHWALAL